VRGRSDGLGLRGSLRRRGRGTRTRQAGEQRPQLVDVALQRSKLAQVSVRAPDGDDREDERDDGEQADHDPSRRVR
jgi:hypothetical protein